MDNKGMFVRVEYTGFLENGEEFGSTRAAGKPLEFECMGNRALPAIDNAVRHMSVGETKTVHIPASEAFGERLEENVVVVPSSQVAGGTNLPVGEVLQMLDGSSHVVPVTVLAVDKEAKTVTLDYNHPLAGKDVIYEIKLLEVLTPEEYNAQVQSVPSGLNALNLAAALSSLTPKNPD